MLNSTEIEEILSKIGLDSFREEVKIKNETRGRKPKEVVNYWFQSFTEITDYDDLAQWVDDVLNGAARLSTGNSHTTALMIFHILKTIPFLTVSEVKDHINQKRAVLGQHVINDDSYIRWIISVTLSVMKSLDYHTERGSKLLRERKENDDLFNFSEDWEGWEREKERIKETPPQTNAELISKLKKAGLNESEITKYIIKRYQA